MKQRHFLAVLLFVLGASVLTAHASVLPPGVPVDWESWPYRYAGSCKISDSLTASVLATGKIENNKLTLVEKASLGDKVLYIYHGHGGTYPDFMLGYTPDGAGWKKFDLDMQGQAEAYIKTFNEAFRQYTALKDADFLDMCRDMHEESGSFLFGLVDKIK